MKIEEKHIIALPLTELWDDSGILEASKTRYLNMKEIRGILRAGAVRFAVANVGEKLKWVDKDDCFSFWKNELKEHVCAEDKVFLKEYPGEYCYWASEWQLVTDERVVLLEKNH